METSLEKAKKAQWDERALTTNPKILVNIGPLSSEPPGLPLKKKKTSPKYIALPDVCQAG